MSMHIWQFEPSFYFICAGKSCAGVIFCCRCDLLNIKIQMNTFVLWVGAPYLLASFSTYIWIFFNSILLWWQNCLFVWELLSIPSYSSKIFFLDDNYLQLLLLLDTHLDPLSSILLWKHIYGCIFYAWFLQLLHTNYICLFKSICV